MQSKEQIISQFFPGKGIELLEPFGNGHINDTYRVHLSGDSEDFILQKINVDVFTDPRGLVDNHHRIQELLFKEDAELEIPMLFPTCEGGYLVMDEVKGAWRMMNFIRDSRSVEVVSHPGEAREAGHAFGWFNRICAGLDASGFKEAIKDFHRLSFRLGQLDAAIAANSAGRLEEARGLVEFYLERREKLMQIEELSDRGEIPLHVTHNDTKINNLLFRGDKACAVIDLDTVGPGIFYYDFGDAIRTIANTGAEDEKDLDLVSFNPEAFEAFALAYLTQVKEEITGREKEFFHLAPVLMTFIMGIRFLADYLNGDKYYKTGYAGHNMVRSRVQQKLIREMEAREHDMKKVISNALT